MRSSGRWREPVKRSLVAPALRALSGLMTSLSPLTYLKLSPFMPMASTHIWLIKHSAVDLAGR